MRRLAMICCALILAACQTPSRRVPVVTTAPVPEDATYVVQAGDTLYSISFKRSLDYREVARWNGIGADYRIYVGQKLRLTAPTGPVAVPPTKSETKTAVDVPPGAPPRWQWPVDGPVLGSVSLPLGGSGLRLAGAPQSDVRAAAAGKVVYTGAGLRAYGLLVIVKHDDTWLSAYGYNHEILVHEGDLVREGQTLAHMGEGPGGAPMLYFEIRSQGKPVDPLKWLPRR